MMGPPAPAPQMGPPAPAPGGGGGMDQTMYQQRLAQIQAMPPGPEKDAALAALSADYEGQQTAAAQQMKLGADMASQGAPGVTQLGGKYATAVAANPLEHMAAGLRTYKGMKDMKEAKETTSGLSKQKQKGLMDLLRAFKP